MIMDDTQRHATSLSCTTHVLQDQDLIVKSLAYFVTFKEANFQQVKFDDGDPRDPKNFSYARKWAITVTCCVFSGITCDF